MSQEEHVAGKSIPHPFFQPRIEPWLDWHRTLGKLPERYKRSTVRDLYDDLDISMRYVDYYTSMPHPIDRKLSKNVTVRTSITGEKMTVASRSSMSRRARISLSLSSG